jgi:hypothetical protein
MGRAPCPNTGYRLIAAMLPSCWARSNPVGLAGKGLLGHGLVRMESLGCFIKSPFYLIMTQGAKENVVSSAGAWPQTNRYFLPPGRPSP